MIEKKRAIAGALVNVDCLDGCISDKLSRVVAGYCKPTAQYGALGEALHTAIISIKSPEAFNRLPKHCITQLL